MRPQRNAAENDEAELDPNALQIASMRPQRNAAENRRAGYFPRARPARFNEAAA